MVRVEVADHFREGEELDGAERTAFGLLFWLLRGTGGEVRGTTATFCDQWVGGGERGGRGERAAGFSGGSAGGCN